jgi:hypothetical protein
VQLAPARRTFLDGLQNSVALMVAEHVSVSLHVDYMLNDPAQMRAALTHVSSALIFKMCRSLISSQHASHSTELVAAVSTAITERVDEVFAMAVALQREREAALSAGVTELSTSLAKSVCTLFSTFRAVLTAVRRSSASCPLAWCKSRKICVRCSRSPARRAQSILSLRRPSARRVHNRLCSRRQSKQPVSSKTRSWRLPPRRASM